MQKWRLYVHFDCLNERNTIVKSNLQFEEVEKQARLIWKPAQTGLCLLK
jgi:hypothetical protein